VETLAAALSEPRDTIEDVYEPYLLQIGMLGRTPRGRVATRKAYLHLGRQPNDTSGGERGPNDNGTKESQGSLF
jgi:Holliday junction DNA helicase RuvB